MTEAEWRVSFNLPAMIGALRGKSSERLWRLYAVACVRHFENSMRDARSRRALEVAERFADGAATREELSAARAHAEAAAEQARRHEWFDEARANFDLDPEYKAVYAAMEAADAALQCLVEDIGTTFEGQPPAIADSLGYPDLLREKFGNPFRWNLIEPAWLSWNDGAVRKVAQGIYDGRAFDALPVLADALEEAGCTDADILPHCREPGDHVRGCWVIDLLLGVTPMTEAEWLASADPDPMLDHLLNQFGMSRGEMPPRESFTIRTPEERKTAEGLAVKMRERKLRLFACACCRRIWDVLTDERSRKAIEASELFADRLITQRQLTAACGAARKVSLKVLNTPGPDGQGPLRGAPASVVQAVQAAHEVAKSAQTIPSRAQLMTYLPSDIVNRVACCAEDLGTPRLDERKQLAVLLRDIIGNPFRPVAVMPNERTASMVGLAQAIYDDRAFERLPILADALEEAGCTHTDILNHCRQPGEHARGCWVVDLVLGKE